MSLKTVTLIAAIAQLLAFVNSTVWFAREVGNLTLHGNVQYFIGEPLYLIANLMMIVFLFVLFSRQKGKG